MLAKGFVNYAAIVGWAAPSSFACSNHSPVTVFALACVENILSKREGTLSRRCECANPQCSEK